MVRQTYTYRDYRERLAKSKGFISERRYQDYLAQMRGFASDSDYKKEMARRRQSNPSNKALSALISRRLEELGENQVKAVELSVQQFAQQVGRLLEAPRRIGA